MLTNPLNICATAVGLTVLLFSSLKAEERPHGEGLDYFEQHIRPVLINRCYECHSSQSDSVMGGLRVDSRTGLLAGGDNGTSIIPGDPRASLLISALRYEELEMPPEGKLSEETINHFERWIEMGAPDPRLEEPQEAPRALPEQQATHWAFTPIPQSRASPPQVTSSASCNTEVDRFILAKLEKHGLHSVDAAERRVLIRRAYFDLWGLPPEPEEVEEFVADASPHAFTQLVDRLLASPNFGQRWGRHWLDIARFGESTGHERNFLYPHAWRYRDYVINAFNADKPYDRFIIEQIAGDLLPAESIAQRDEQVIATGFLAIGARNLLGADESFRFDTIDDQINVSMQAILGLTVTCARCHDHKFDPISTAEYYGLAGIFYSTETLYGTQPGTGNGNNRHPTPLIPLGASGSQHHQALLEHQSRLGTLTKDLAGAENLLKKINRLPEAELAAKQNELQEARKQVDRIEADILELKRTAPPFPPYAMGVRDAAQISDTEIRISGEAGKKGELVPRQFLSCCHLTTPTLPDASSGRRELAQWMIDPDHPLTARVMANRIWHHLMGRGIVPSVDNFGLNGQLPTHPELLDWLALEFRSKGWSIKHLIRCIMLSRTYQLSSAVEAACYERDPDNIMRWRWNPKRLDAESIRDAMLSCSGELIDGPPEFGSVAASLGDGCLVRQIDADQLNRESAYRSIYLPAARFFEPENLQIFDAASASLVVGDRPETNVPAQVLYLLNNSFVIDRSQATARRLAGFSTENPLARIDRAYRLILGRPATDSELQRAFEYIHQTRALGASGDASRPIESAGDERTWASFVQALLVGAEFRFLY